MPQLLAPPFSNGSDGLLSISANTTDAPIDSASTATSGTTSISATNASFVAGQLIMIHQTRGTSAGQWELNKISSYVAGTITTVSPLTYTYTSGAQVLVIEQHSGITIDSGKTLTAKAWNGTVGGIVALMSSGLCDVNGTISANGKGYRGGVSSTVQGDPADMGYQGEGNPGFGTNPSPFVGYGGSINNNGNGGGGGCGRIHIDAAWHVASGGAGGANGTAGAGGYQSPSGEEGTVGGHGGLVTVGVEALTTMSFGGGGGAGGYGTGSYAGVGGKGGGIILVFTRQFSLSGSVTSSGYNGGNSSGSGDGYAGPGGGGAGGSVLIKSKTSILGATKITAVGGDSGSHLPSGGGDGGGGDGRIRCESCSLTGTTSPSLSSVIGGQNYCGGAASILE